MLKQWYTEEPEECMHHNFSYQLQLTAQWVKQAGMSWCVCFFVTTQNLVYLHNKLYGMDLSRRTIDYVPWGVEMPGVSGGRKALLLCYSLTFMQTFRQYLESFFFPLTLCVFQTSYHYKNLFPWHNYFGFRLWMWNNFSIHFWIRHKQNSPWYWKYFSNATLWLFEITA